MSRSLSASASAGAAGASDGLLSTVDLEAVPESKPRSPRAGGGPRGGGGAGGRRASRLASARTTGAYIVLLVQLFAWLFIAAAVWSFSASDWPSPAVYPHAAQVANWCGTWGALPAYWLHSMLGWGVWPLVGLWGLGVFFAVFVGEVPRPAVRLAGVALVTLAVATLHGLFWPSAGALPDLGGGLLGTYFAAGLESAFSGFGSSLVVALVLGVGLFLTFDAWVVIGPMLAYRAVREKTPPVASATAGAARRAWGWARPLGGIFRRGGAGVGGVGAAAGAEPTPAGRVGRRKAKAAGESGKPATIDETAGGLGGTESFDPDAPSEGEGTGAAVPAAPAKRRGAKDKPAPAEPAEVDEPTESADAGGAEGAEAESGEAEPSLLPPPPARKAFSPEALRAKIAKLPVRFASTERKSATEADLRDVQNVAELEGYQFPGLDQLEEPEANYPEKMESFVREQATALEQALKVYRIDGEVVGIDSGPVITLYEVRLAPGTKVAAIQSVSSDLARSLRAVNIRIVPNTEGRDTVGVEVPNPHKEKVRLKELMAKSDAWSGMKLPMFLGKDASGNPLIADLAAMPHMLIAGTTGSGKSVCMSSILMSFLYTKKPNELKLVLVDPKMVELSQFKDVPHLMCPVVTEMSKAAAILEWAVRKMDERYELLMEAGVRDITGYNALTPEELKERFAPKDEAEEARIPKKLPYMVFVIDELADMMMTNKEVEHSIVRIAQKARAVGIHLIVATQRPQANVVTGLIKSNMPARVCFKVASGMDSRIVMDQKGGELLLGQGDMLYLSPRSSKLSRAQGTLVDDKEIRRVTKFLKDIAAPTFERSLMQLRTGSEAAGGMGGHAGGEDDSGAGGGAQPGQGDFLTPGAFGNDGMLKGQSDPLFEKAVEIVMETQKGSVSMLQRRLAIGYTRSSRLMDAMWRAGIVGDHKGTVDRDVLISADEWEAMKAQAAADAAKPEADAEPQLFKAPGAGAATGAAAAQGAGADARAPF